MNVQVVLRREVKYWMKIPMFFQKIVANSKK